MLQRPKGQLCHAPRHSPCQLGSAWSCLSPKPGQCRAQTPPATLNSDYGKPSANLLASFIQIQNPWRVWVKLNMTMLFTTSPAISTASQTTTFRLSTSDSSPFGCELFPTGCLGVSCPPEPVHDSECLSSFPLPLVFCMLTVQWLSTTSYNLLLFSCLNSLLGCSFYDDRHK